MKEENINMEDEKCERECDGCGDKEEMYAPSRYTGEFICYDCWISEELDAMR